MVITTRIVTWYNRRHMMAGPTNPRTYVATITRGPRTEVTRLVMADALDGFDEWPCADRCPATGVRPTDDSIEHTTSPGKCRFLFNEPDWGGEVHLYCSHDTHSINFWAVVCDAAKMAINNMKHPAEEDLHRVSKAYAAWLPQASQGSVSITDPLLCDGSEKPPAPSSPLSFFGRFWYSQSSGDELSNK
jgi:hypothetical protein